MRNFCLCIAVAFFFPRLLANATTKGLSQIVTPDLQPAGDLSLTFQAQSLHIAEPYQLQAELVSLKAQATLRLVQQANSLNEFLEPGVGA